MQSFCFLLDGRVLVSVKNRVDLVAPFEDKVVPELLTACRRNSFPDVGKDAKVCWVLLVVLAALEHAGADQASVPAVHVTANNVGGRVVTFFYMLATNVMAMEKYLKERKKGLDLPIM